MRNAFSQSLVQAALADERVVLLTGDHGYALFDDFRRDCPSQYINAGVAEQNMVGVAAGMAKAGFRPVVYGLSAFVPIRVLEQIKLAVCYESLPVTFIGDGAGVVYSTLGMSHQCAEDIAALRALPHIALLSPCDAAEMTVSMQMALRAEHPVYLRMGKADASAVHKVVPDLQWGHPLALRHGEGPLAWLATGSMVSTAMAAAERWPGSSVYSVPSLKPLDEAAITAICESHRALIVIEEHSIFGGLGSAIAEVAATHSPTYVCRIGIPDQFSEKCGTYSYLMKVHGLDRESVIARVESFLTEKSLFDAPQLKAA